MSRSAAEAARGCGPDGPTPAELRVYMLVGYDKRESWESIFYRHEELRALGCDPFPMVFNRAARQDLCAFARWLLRHLYRKTPWPAYRHGTLLSPWARATSDAAWAKVASGWKPSWRLDMA